MGVSGGGEGVKYLPLGYDNVTQGRQHAPKQLQTCQNRKGLMAQKKQECYRVCFSLYATYSVSALETESA